MGQRKYELSVLGTGDGRRARGGVLCACVRTLMEPAEVPPHDVAICSPQVYAIERGVLNECVDSGMWWWWCGGRWPVKTSVVAQ